MPGAALHADVDVPVSTASALADVATIAGVAGELERIAADLQAVTARLAELVRDGAHDAMPGASAAELMSAAGSVHHSAQVACSLGLVQMEVTRAYLDDGVSSASRWVEWHAGLSGGVAAELGRVARCLELYPRIGSAFLAGDARSGHLALIDRIIPRRFRGTARDESVHFLRDVQTELLTGIAECVTPWEFRRFCAKVQRLIDTDGPPPGDGATDSELWLRKRSDQWWDLTGLLNPSDGALLTTLLEERDERNRRARRDDPDLAGVCDDRTAEARASACLLELALAGASAARPGRAGVFIHMDLGDLIALGAEAPPLVGWTEANYDITDETLWSLLAGADVTPIISDAGTPLSYGRTRRLAPAMLRHALAHRDRTCWLPGCDPPALRLQQHHLDLWRCGGTTDPPNLIGGCPFHHGQLHRDGWRVIPPPDGRPGQPIVLKPDGTMFDPTPRWRRHQQQQPSLARIEQHAAVSR